MDVIIDNQVSPPISETGCDVLTVISAISERLHEERRAIMQISIDGFSITAANLAQTLQGKSSADVCRLEIITEKLDSLINDTLNELELVLPELSPACHRLAEVFQGEAPYMGYEPFQELATIWKTIKERESQVINALDLDIDSAVVKGNSLRRYHDELNDYLMEAADALEANDCVLLGDLLEYELAPKAETETEIIAWLRARAQEKLSL